MPSEHLSLFPTSASNSVPKSCLKQSNRGVRTPSPVANSPMATKSEMLRGVALQFTSRQAKTIIVEPAQAHIKHSLFCEPEASRTDSRMDEVRSQPQPPRSPRADSPRPQAMSSSQPANLQGRSSLPDRVTSPQSPPRSGSPQFLRASHALYRSPTSAPKGTPPPLPKRSVSQENAPSLFPIYDHSVPLSEQRYYPSPDRVLTLPEPVARRRSSSAPRPALKLSTSSASMSAEPEVANLSQLQALWSAASGSASSNNNRVKKIRLAMHRETHPTSSNSSSDETTLDIGFGNFYTFSYKAGNPVRPEDAFTEMFARRRHPLKEEITVPIAHVDLAQTHYHHPETSSGSSSSSSSSSSSNNENEHEALATTIFPQTAALAALEAAAASPRAKSIARFDPDASSPQAAQLAFDAVAEAKQREQSEIICTTNTTNTDTNNNTSTNSHAVQDGNSYALLHPSLGHFAISVHGRIDLFNKAQPPSRFPRCSSTTPSSSSRFSSRISLHTPSSASATNKLPDSGTELASLDISAGTLELDLEAFRRLGNKYIIDVAVCALMGVAFMESERFSRRMKGITSSATTAREFAGPPGELTNSSSSLGRKGRMMKKFGFVDASEGGASRAGGTRSALGGHGGKQMNKKYSGMEKPLPPPPRSSVSSRKGREEGKLPGGMRVVLKLLGFSFKAIVWLLSLGVKVLSKVILSIGKAARE